MKKKLIVFIMILLSIMMILSIFNVKNHITRIQGLTNYYNAPTAQTMEIKYRIKISKIDSETNELLSGAKFSLKALDGTEIANAVTGTDGTLDFGEITTYGEGIDSYYIEEEISPEGYKITQGERIRLKIIKTVLDPENGLYTLSMTYTALDGKINTANYDFVPISNAEQLQKIGSGEQVEVDGSTYEFNANSNYKLTQDIDLSGINWTPINKNLECVIDGAGHKIKNLTITSNSNLDKSEIGLFSSFKGIIENIELENVNIDIKGFTNGATTETGKTGVGSFVGVMKEGYIINSKVSGSITAETDNIGGFVGHTLENGIVVVEDSENNSNVKGSQDSSNVGGIIGCSLGSVSIKNTNNTGKIEIADTNEYNAGGLIGYVNPSNYQDLDLVQKCEDKIISIVVENASTEDNYNLNLKIVDGENLQAINGAVYTVYDVEKHVIAGLDHIKLNSGYFSLFYRDIVNSGTDTYYIKENEMIKGYKSLSGVIKVEIERYWDEETVSYKVRPNIEVLSEDDFAVDIAKNNDSKKSLTGLTYNQGLLGATVNFARTDSNTAKAEFINCKNTGEVISKYMNAGGIVATVHGYAFIDSCENTGYVHTYNEVDNESFGKAGGIISELYAWKQNIEIINCKNSGKVESTNNKEVASASGIIACLFADANITGCKNTGIINAGARSSASGIIAEGRGKLTISSCENSGIITAFASNENNDYNCNAAGIIAKNKTLFDGDSSVAISSITFDDNIIAINNCTNTGDINSSFNMGGILAQTDAGTVRVTNCETKNCKIYDTGVADKGGIVGVTFTTDVNISNCSVDNIELIRTSDNRNNPDSQWENNYGSTGGIIGNMSAHRRDENAEYGSDYLTLDKLKVTNCTVSNSELETKNHDVGGILGNVDQGDPIIDIEDCNVTKCSLFNNGHKGTDCNVGGIFGTCLYGIIHIKGCDVSESTIKSECLDTTEYGSSNAGGILACSHNSNKVFVENCNVSDSKINNKAPRNSTSNAGGIIAFQYQSTYPSDWAYKIDNCHVLNTDITSNENSVGGIAGGATVYSSPDEYQILVSNCSYKNGKLYVINNYNANANIGGIMAAAMGRNSFENCVVENADIKFENESRLGENAAGILGFGYMTTKLTDCKVKDTDIYTTANGAYGGGNAAGIAGATGDKTTIKNCDTENVTITANSVSNVGGIFGGSYYNEISLEDCDVKASTIYNGRTVKEYENNSCTAGIIGKGSGYGLTLKNLSITDSTITGAGKNIGGILAVDYGNVTLENSKVNNITIVDNGTNDKSNNDTPDIVSRCIGGAIGACTNGITVNGVEIDGLDITGHVLDVGGVTGWINCIDDFKNVSVNNLVINNEPMVAEFDSYNPYNTKYLWGDVSGMIGCLGYFRNSSSISNCSLTNSTINSKGHNAGGIIGTYYGSEDSSFDSITLDNVIFNNTNEIKTHSGEMGGIVGYSLHLDEYDSKSESMTVTNSNLSNLVFDMKQDKNVFPRHVGGILGYGYNLIVDNIEESDITINNETYGLTGGILGMHKNTEAAALEASNIVIDGIEMSANSQTGGIAALVNKTDLENINIKDADIESNGMTAFCIAQNYSGSNREVSAEDIVIKDSILNTKQAAGGILGFTDKDFTVNNITLDNANITSEYGCSGGISANNCGGLIASNINIKNGTTINGGSHAGGLTGFTWATNLENIDIDEIEVTSTGAMAGSVIGCVTGNAVIDGLTIDNADVSATNCAGGAIGCNPSATTIEGLAINCVEAVSTNASAGAVVGIESSTLTIPEASIQNVDITGYQHAGTVSGVAITLNATDITINNSDVTGTGTNVSGLVGGVIGVGTLNISGSSIQNVDLAGNYLMGGMVTTGTINSTNNTLRNITLVQNNPLGSSPIGGITGVMYGGSIIDNNKLYNIEMSAKGVVAGGIVGVASSEVKNCSVDGLSIIYPEGVFSEIGGIVGCLQSNLTNCSVNNATISGHKVPGGDSYGDIGGVVAVSNLGCVVDGASITNSVITSDKEAGGIIGVASGPVRNCTVDNVVVTSTAQNLGDENNRSFSGGDAGGAIGATAYEVKNIAVTNSTVISPKLAGGVVGAGREGYTTLENLTCENNTIEYGNEEEGNGAYIGAPEIYEGPLSGLMIEAFEEEFVAETFLSSAKRSELEISYAREDTECHSPQEEQTEAIPEIEEPKSTVIETEEVKDTTNDLKDDEIESSDEPKVEEIAESDEEFVEEPKVEKENEIIEEQHIDEESSSEEQVEDAFYTEEDIVAETDTECHSPQEQQTEQQIEQETEEVEE